MEKYLRMSDVFKSELFIDSDCDDVIVDDLSLTVIESFGGSDVAKFAVHAINSHDELVAMNKELQAAIDEVYACFDAALTEGWNEAMAEEDISRIKDIYCRRIDSARSIAAAVLSGGAV